MSPRRTVATALRVLNQLRHDHRTLALIFVVPCLLLILVKYVFEGQTFIFYQIEPMILGVFPLTIMFLITSIATLRERRTGTLDRLMTMPISKLDFVLGYAIAFALIATVQAALATWVVTGLLSVPIAGGGFAMLLGAVAAALLGTTFGLFVSAFAATEFQAVQFMPIFLFPQILTCGLLVARNHMASWLQTISDYLPMTYSVDAMKRITHEATWSVDLTRDFMIVLLCAFGVLVLGAITIRRQD